MQNHDLNHEFPQFQEKILELKASDHHFKKLCNQYQDVNSSIYRIENNVEVATDAVLNDYRMKRVHLKDELYGFLNKN